MGRLELRFRGPLFGAVENPVDVRIHNASPLDWPGFDNQREGLVQLRYTVALPDASLEERARATSFAPLLRDVRAGQRVDLTTIFEPPLPERGARHEVCVDLVQRLGDEVVALPVEPQRMRVAVHRRTDTTGLQDLLDQYRIERAPVAPCGS
jgi:hypothetical protein